jgi:uncharacterized membrane protein YfcA
MKGAQTMVTVVHNAVLWMVIAGLIAGLINSTIGFGNLVSFVVLTSVLGVPALGAHLANQVAAPASFATAAWVSRRDHAATRRMMLAGCGGTMAGGLALARIPAQWVTIAAPGGVLAGALLLVLVPLTRSLTFPWQVPGLAVAGLWGGTIGAGVGSFVMPCVDGPAAGPTRNVLCFPMGVAVALPLAVLSPRRINWTIVAALCAGMLVGGYLGSTVLRWLPRRQSTSDRLREVMAAMALGAFAYLYTDSLAVALGVLVVALNVVVIWTVWRIHVVHVHAQQGVSPSTMGTAAL